jgi:transcriptional regulator with XRE-family HTH domain
MAVRERRDVTQRDVAVGVGVSGAAVSQWEAGQRVPKEEDVRKLAAYFGVTPAYLRYGVSSGTSVLDRVAPEPERPASELLQRKAPATKASAKKGRGRKAS